MADIAEGSVVLNIGSGGRLGRRIKKTLEAQGCTVDTFDIDPIRQPDIVGDITTYQFEKQYNAIFMMEVLEHIPEPGQAVQNLKTALKPNGQLIMSTPFIFGIHDRPHDYYRYTKYGLEYLLRDFTDVNIKARNSWAEALCVALARMCIEPGLLPKLFSPIAVIVALIHYPLAWALGKIVKSDSMTTGYIVRARKEKA